MTRQDETSCRIQVEPDISHDIAAGLRPKQRSFHERFIGGCYHFNVSSHINGNFVVLKWKVLMWWEWITCWKDWELLGHKSKAWHLLSITSRTFGGTFTYLQGTLFQFYATLYFDSTYIPEGNMVIISLHLFDKFSYFTD